MSQTNTAPQVTGKMFLYESPELLNVEGHKDLAIGRLDDPFYYAAKVRVLPLTISEVPAASHHYPIAFMSMEQPAPMAVVGIIDEINLFVDEQGQWSEFDYIPGYVRRYPFGAAMENNSDRFGVVIDRDYKGFADGGDTKLFDGTETSQFTKDAIEFTKRYEEDRRLTMQFAEELKKYDLIAGQTAQYTPQGGGEQQPFAQYIGVDETKLREMSDEKFLELRKSNVLPVIYAQLMSMGHWRNLVMRRAKRYNLNDSNVFQPLVLS